MDLEPVLVMQQKRFSLVLRQKRNDQGTLALVLHIRCYLHLVSNLYQPRGLQPLQQLELRYDGADGILRQHQVQVPTNHHHHLVLRSTLIKNHLKNVHLGKAQESKQKIST